MISSFHNKDEVRVDKFDTLLLPHVCKYTKIRTILKPCSQNWGVGQLFPQLLKRIFLHVSYYLGVNISDALGTMLED
jgi:hypothetical protein